MAVTMTSEVVLFLSFVSLAPMTLAQSVELTCNASVAYATVNANGVLEFTAEFPEDYVVASEVEYDPGALGTWSSIAEGVINVVRPGSVTEGKKFPPKGRKIVVAFENVWRRKLYVHAPTRKDILYTCTLDDACSYLCLAVGFGVKCRYVYSWVAWFCCVHPSVLIMISSP